MRDGNNGKRNARHSGHTYGKTGGKTAGRRRRADFGRRENNDRRADSGRRESYGRRKEISGAFDISEKEPSEDLLYGRNSVMEALKSGRTMEKLMVQDGSGGAAGRILELAKEQGVVIERVSKVALDRMTDGGNHQGVAAIVSAHKYAELPDTFALAEEHSEDPFLVILDGIEDPGNLGAVIRTAECAGASGVIIPKRRAAGLTESAAKAACGAVEYLPCVRETNIARTIDQLKEQGVWVYACDMDGELYTSKDLTGPIAIVIGAEGKGISPLVRKKCDGVLSIPLKGHINSLNASNAAAVLMYEIRRQRDAEAEKTGNAFG
ncbi:MAG: 23S rRNA (guanosine(2251)-2'-O)-methyltransferase RlmB [Eubacteriales bacterium]|nr:23S rRNA (guanosine(2251)-2'-O)-methyltransferase RlmB [Eubacteriales bacterium]